MSFEPGAVPAAGMIPLSVPQVGGTEERYLQECISGGWVSSVGPFVDRFEREIGALAGVPRAVATVSGTAALHLALLVAGVQEGEEVLVSDLTFIAPAFAVRYVGAWPVLIGAEPDYWQMDPAAVESFCGTECTWNSGVLRNKSTGRRVKAILAVHILGHPCEIDRLQALAAKYGLALIEDCAESIGTEFRGKPVGTFGDAAAFSFNGNKTITCGGGGMLVSRHEDWLRRAKYLSTQAKDDPLEYVHGSIGYNYRLTNLQAAVGCAQLERLGSFVAAKRSIAKRYAEAFAAVPGLQFMREAPWAWCTFWLSTILLDEAVCGSDSRELLAHCSVRGIQTRPLWQPLHLSPALAGCQHFGCTTDGNLFHRALSLPSSVGLAPEDQQYVIGTILAALKKS